MCGQSGKTKLIYAHIQGAPLGPLGLESDHYGDAWRGDKHAHVD